MLEFSIEMIILLYKNVTNCKRWVQKTYNILTSDKYSNKCVHLPRPACQPKNNIVKRHSSSEATFSLKPPDSFRFDKPPPLIGKLNKGDALELYLKMNSIRRLENACAQLYTQKVIRGFCHLYSGQEAVCVGITSMLRPKDYIITAYRAHGWTYLCGVSALGVIGELAGKECGCSRGKGGSMHTYGKNFFGGNGIVGAQVPLGTGLGFAQKYKKSGGISVTLYGDGASNQGQVFESYNMAKLWNLPILFVCENNLYGMGTSVNRSSASTSYYTRAGYIPGIRVDGMDVIGMREWTKFALDWIVQGNGPIVMEAVTYRYFGHSMSDPGISYRSRDEINKVRQTRDPITTFRDKILEKKLVTDAELKKIDNEIKTEIDDAIAKAKACKEVDMSELTADIYAKFNNNIKGTLPWKPLKHKNVSKAINL